MELKKIFVLLIILFFSCTVLAQTQEYSLKDITWQGYISPHLDKQIFSSDEEVSGYLRMENGENFPLVGQRVILQLGTGTYYYPSQLALDNIILEQVFEDQWILPRKIKTINFSLGKLAPGTYHLDAYSWVLKSLFVGSSAIMYNPQSVTFTVKGEEKEEIVIDRAQTNFGKDKVIGPVGFPVKPLESFSGEIFITNNTNLQKDNLKLIIQICDWSNSFCTGDLFESGQEKLETQFSIPKIEANKTIQFDVNLIAPKIPSAYEINIILKENDKILSIYKNRIIVEGGTAKLRKILIDGLKHRNYTLTAIFSGSPDHFTFPDFENFNLKMMVYNDDDLLNQKEENFSNIKTGEVKGKTFDINELIFNKICVEINKNNEIFDKECFTVDIKELQKEYDAAYPEELKIEYTYNELDEQLNLTLSKEILNEVDSRIRILGEDNVLLINDFINTAGIVEKNYSLKKANYTLIVDDFTSKKQKVIYLDLISQNLATESNIKNSCAGLICPIGTVCSSKTYISREGDCCTAHCIPSTISEGILGILTTPLIFWIALILIIISAIILFNVLKNKGRKKL